MPNFSENKELEKQYNRLIWTKFSIFVILVVLFLYLFNWITEHHMHRGGSFTLAGWGYFSILSLIIYLTIQAAIHGYWPFVLLDEKEQKLLFQRIDYRDLLDFRAGKFTLMQDRDGIAREVEEHDGILVFKESQRPTGIYSDLYHKARFRKTSEPA